MSSGQVYINAPHIPTVTNASATYGFATGSIITTPAPSTVTTCGSVYTISGSGSNSTYTYTDGMTVQGKFKCDDLEVDGQNLKELMNTITERLAILSPDPKKLEKFKALKNAYEQYKLLEKLCMESDDND